MSDLMSFSEIDGSGAVLVAAQRRVAMVTLKADLSNKATRATLKKVLGSAVPAPRKIVKGVAWMAPDELLIMVPDGTTPEELVNRLHTGITAPALAVDVSDARAVFTLKGNSAREVLAKGAPVDLSAEAFTLGDFRRTRLGQVAVAFWMEADDEITLVCFASLKQFMFDWLVNAAQKGSLPAYLNR
ncbi:MAG: sarcosine oxidase subunit gamma [Rhodobacteraceae bacterium]|nr:sarcosine oxidase subunit gamma [Paracoccaceae bacterium]